MKMRLKMNIPLALRALIFLVALTSVCCTTSHSAFNAQGSKSKAKPTTEQVKNLTSKISDLPVPEKHCFGGLQFVSEMEGWLSCDRYLWHTLDGGKSWENVHEMRRGRNNVIPYLINFYFVNSKLGWNYTQDSLEKTEDGGRTWKVIDLPVKPDDAEILSIKFLPDGKKGWLAGGVFRLYPRTVLEGLDIHALSPDNKRALTPIIFHTEDGGNTWQQQTVSGKIGSAVTRLHVTDTNQVWAFVGEDLFHYEGTGWKKIDFLKSQCPFKQGSRTVDQVTAEGIRNGPYNINFINDRLGWLSLTNGHVAKTTDGGQTWCDLYELGYSKAELGGGFFLNEIYFVDELNGWGIVSGYALYQTRDGGATWVKMDESIRFDSIFFLNRRQGWGVGKGGVFKINL
jgi:photosystem II stability/assembly factor-like uncharacterized protein